ncbi:TPA: hypothetical protein ACXYQ5_004990 [Klebsiella pneumoniae]
MKVSKGNKLDLAKAARECASMAESVSGTIQSITQHWNQYCNAAALPEFITDEVFTRRAKLADFMRRMAESLESVADTKPVLFTHSYYSGTGAEVNPAAAYISDAMICKGKKFSEYHTTENGDRYVFSFWLDVSADLLVAVRPSDEMIAAWKASHGGLLTALMPGVMFGGELANMTASMRELSSASGFSWQAVAGLVRCEDLRAHLIKLLGAEYADLIAAKFPA